MLLFYEVGLAAFFVSPKILGHISGTFFLVINAFGSEVTKFLTPLGLQQLQVRLEPISIHGGFAVDKCHFSRAVCRMNW